MNKKLLIFDMDGTLLDSMKYWATLGSRYLKFRGKIVDENVDDIIDNMTLRESAQYLKNNYKIEDEISIIQEEILSLIKDDYLKKIPLKKGVKKYLIKMKNKGYKMCILTTSNKENALNALRRENILFLFDNIFTDEDFKMSKRNPEIYINTCKEMDAVPYETVVYEDSLYAVESAKKSGCIVIGVHDDFSENNWSKIKSIADETIISFDKL